MVFPGTLWYHDRMIHRVLRTGVAGLVPHWWLCLVLAASASIAVAAPGDVDLSFTNGTGANAVIFATKVRTNDNKIYIGGAFDGYNGTVIKRIARLSQTGALDTTFATAGTDGSVIAIALQPDLKCVIGGDFFGVGNANSKRLARLNDDGSLDTAFTTALGTAADGGVDALALQTDGKILLGGRFQNFNGVARNRITRVNADGSADTTFNPGTGPDQPVVSIQLQTDGKSIVTGTFTTFNGTARSGIVRLNMDGSVDTTFNPGTGASGLVNGAIIQTDGKIIVYGGFNFFNGQARAKIIRLNADGSIDTAYAAATAINSDIRDAELLPTGKLLIVGVFSDINGVSRRSVARLDVNGAHDTTFNPGTGAGLLDSPSNAAVNASALDTNSLLVVVGEFRQFNNIPLNFITRVQTADPTPPLIISHPTNLFILTGTTATFAVTASGTAPLFYQWRFNGVNIAGATNNPITIPNAQAINEGLYSVVVSNAAGTATSSNASLTLGTLPFLTVAPPASQTNTVGQNTNFTVVAGGTAPLFYQWLFNGTALANQTNAALNLTNLQLTNGGVYTIIVSNLFGAVTNSATEVIAAPPAILPGAGGGDPATGQPQSLTVVQGQNATFSVNAVGSTPLTYQWRFGGVNITGATNSSVTLTNVQPSQAGLYSVVISNPFGTTTSSNATLTVLVPPTIIVQPVSQSLTNGATLNLSVTATGSPTLTYQWSLNGTAIPGATAATLTLLNVQESLEGNYVCVVSNPYGTATSQVAVVTVQSPPQIFDNGHPQPLTVIQGSNATFSVSATGDQPFTYQWRFNGTNITGATNNPLALTGVLTNQAGNYSVVVSNPFGSATSSNALLTVRVPPFIIVQPTPTNQTVIVGSNATITVVAGGDPTLTYQWRLNGVNITGATAAILNLTSVQTSQLGLYSVVVSNPYGTVTSSNATLDVKTAPFIVTQPQSGQPQSLTVLQGSPAAFSVTVGGDGPFAYQWRFGGVSITGATNSSFGLASAFTTNAGLYSVVITSPYGSVTSSNATLTVNVPPTIVVQPVSVESIAGSNATFSVTATGDAPLTYQWRFGGVNIAGATGATLTLNNVQAANAGLYSVVVSNPFGTATSTNASLTLKTPPSFLAHPQSLTVLKGTGATFSVTPGGDGPFTYQWLFAGVPISGATNNPLTLTNVQTNQAGLYSVVLTSPYGTATSSNATLTVLDPPVIIVQPASVSVLTGGTATFSVTAVGRPTLLYQWCKNGVDIVGATNATLTIANVSTADVANYCVKVTNADGSVTSVNAALALSNRILQVVTTQTTNLTAGAAVAVPVALLAEGGENRVRASVAYDTNKLAFVSVTSPFTTAALTTTNATAAGQIGFDLTLAGSGTLSAGSNAVVFLNFTVAAGVTQSIASLTLQGIPTTNQVLDVASAPLACYFLSGAVVFKATGTNAYQLRSQTGATEEALPIFNPAGSATALTFLRISFFDLGVDSLGNAIYLINATGTNNGVPYVLIPTTIAPAGSFPLNVEYYVSDRVTSPKPRLVIEVVTGGFPVAPAGTVLAPDRAEFHLGRFKIDFLTAAGKTYYIQFSASAVGPWDTSFPGIAGTGGRLQWVDTGPPRTTSLPTAAGTRFYRLLQVP
ncbi:MAG: immunoglobulin domain-containing protein [Limisphaerales bacterium]